VVSRGAGLKNENRTRILRWSQLGVPRAMQFPEMPGRFGGGDQTPQAGRNPFDPARPGPGLR